MMHVARHVTIGSHVKHTHCSTLHTATLQQHTATEDDPLQHPATPCNTLQHLQHPATPCNSTSFQLCKLEVRPLHTAPNRNNTLQHTATHRNNALHQTATHCNSTSFQPGEPEVRLLLLPVAREEPYTPGEHRRALLADLTSSDGNCAM